MGCQYSKKVIRRLQRRAKKWIRSPEGKIKIAKILRDSDITINRLNLARKIDPKTLFDEITI